MCANSELSLTFGLVLAGFCLKSHIQVESDLFWFVLFRVT